MTDRQGRSDPNLLLGLDAPDDAGIYRITQDLALVQSVDFFTPIVDDPYAWGSIAAANAMSDIYAMGGVPLTALNLVGWPMDLDLELLVRVLEGAADKADEAGCSIVGGHTVDDPEPKFGMAVTGTVRPSQVLTVAGATAGLMLFLTKPLSMGIISTAIKRQAAPPKLVAKATEIMAALNKPAAEAMQEVGVEAATDVTGFGLAGHLHQMLRTSGVGAEIWDEALPVLDGVRELAAAGMVPGGTLRNRDFFGDHVSFATGTDELTRTIFFDAQTSGGMLIAVEEKRAEALRAELIERGAHTAAVIGMTTEGPPGHIEVRSEK